MDREGFVFIVVGNRFRLTSGHDVKSPPEESAGGTKGGRK